MARWGMVVLVVGALGVINTWDLPTYLGLAVAAFALGEYVRTGRFPLVKTGIFAMLLGGASVLFYWPFFSRYQALAVGGVGLVKQKDALSDWLTIWGFFYFLAASFVLVGAGLLLLRREDVEETFTTLCLFTGLLIGRVWLPCGGCVSCSDAGSGFPGWRNSAPWSVVSHPPSAIRHRPSAIRLSPFTGWARRCSSGWFWRGSGTSSRR